MRSDDRAAAALTGEKTGHEHHRAAPTGLATPTRAVQTTRAVDGPRRVSGLGLRWVWQWPRYRFDEVYLGGDARRLACQPRRADGVLAVWKVGGRGFSRRHGPLASHAWPSRQAAVGRAASGLDRQAALLPLAQRGIDRNQGLCKLQAQFHHESANGRDSTARNT